MDLDWYANNKTSIYGKLVSGPNMKTATCSGPYEDCPIKFASLKDTKGAASPQNNTSKAKKEFFDLPLEVSYEYFSL